MSYVQCPLIGTCCGEGSQYYDVVLISECLQAQIKVNEAAEAAEAPNHQASRYKDWKAELYVLERDILVSTIDPNSTTIRVALQGIYNSCNTLEVCPRNGCFLIGNTCCETSLDIHGFHDYKVMFHCLEAQLRVIESKKLEKRDRALFLQRKIISAMEMKFRESGRGFEA